MSDYNFHGESHPTTAKIYVLGTTPKNLGPNWKYVDRNPEIKNLVYDL